ncbi:MAG TPA: transporter [Gemmatimonadaceae bacterium]|nr:transporter [Gemmatimonadaceae bacterium]
MPHVRRAVRCASLVAATLAAAGAARAQANIPQFRGDFGILSGTLPKPGFYSSALYSSYEPENTIAANETAFSHLQPPVNVFSLQLGFTVPAVWAAGQYGFSIIIPWADLTIPTPDAKPVRSWGFSDIYIQPMKLGWTFPSADVVAGFGVYMPTGRFHDGANNNTGFGMWSYEMSAGSTVYLGSSHQSSASALVAYQVQSHVEDTDKRAGQVLTVEGGAGHTLIRHFGQLGVAYYAMWKLTNDQNFNVSPLFAGKNRMFGVGPEITIPFPALSDANSVTLRYLVEAGSHSATQGNTLFVALTMGRLP